MHVNSGLGAEVIQLSDFAVKRNGLVISVAYDAQFVYENTKFSGMPLYLKGHRKSDN
jgi:hypothetical protein